MGCLLSSCAAARVRQALEDIRLTVSGYTSSARCRYLVMHKVRVKIKSVFTKQIWEGDVEVPKGLAKGHLLEFLWRKFNAVTGDDADWMKEVGFEQPSMSVGDEVTVNRETFIVTGTGFRPA